MDSKTPGEKISSSSVLTDAVESDSVPAVTRLLEEPFSVVTLGGTGQGKSVFCHRILEVYGGDEVGRDPYVVTEDRDGVRHLPDYYTALSISDLLGEMDSYSDIAEAWPDNSIVHIDVSDVLRQAEQSQEDIQELFDHLVASTHSADTCLVFEAGTTKCLNEYAVRLFDAHFIRYPDNNQIRFCRDEMQDVFEQARDCLGKYTSSAPFSPTEDTQGDVRRHIFVDSTDFTGEYPHPVRLPSYWSDDLAHRYADNDDLKQIISPDKVLDTIHKLSLAKDDGERISQDEVRNEVEHLYGEVYQAVIAEHLDEFVENGLCNEVTRDGRQEYELTPSGVQETVTTVTGATRGSDKHQTIAREVTYELKKAGFISSLKKQNGGGQVPDAVAEVPIDMTADSLPEMKSKYERLEEQYPQVAGITGGRDINIEAESSVDTTSQIFANLRNALKMNRLCLYALQVDSGEDVVDKAEKLARKLIDPACKKRVDAGEEYLYTDTRSLKTDAGFIAVREADTGHTEWVRTPSGKFELRTRSGNKTVCRLNSDDDEVVADPERIPAYYYKENGRITVEWVTEGECKQKTYDSSDAFKQDWTRIKEPFVPEQYTESEPVSNYWKIAVITERGEVVEYQPKTIDGDVCGTVCDLCSDTSSFYRGDTPAVGELSFQRSSSVHWHLYLLAAFSDMDENKATSAEISDFASSTQLIEAHTEVNSITDQQKASQTLSTCYQRDLVDRTYVDTDQTSTDCRYQYTLSDRGWKELLSAGTPTETSSNTPTEVEPRYDPETGEITETRCQLCNHPSGNIHEHLRQHTGDNSRLETPITEDTLQHWILFALEQHTDSKLTSKELSDRLNETPVHTSYASIATTLSTLAREGVISRQKRSLQSNEYEYWTTDQSRLLLSLLGEPSKLPAVNGRNDKEEAERPASKLIGITQS